MSPRPAYPPLPPWKWPEPGVRTWTPPERALFDPCTGRVDCETRSGCPVGRVVTVGGPYGCDCPCHERPVSPRRAARGG